MNAENELLFNNEVMPDMRDYLRVLKNRAWVGITFFLGVVVIVTIGTFLLAPIYKATTTLMIDVPSPELLSVRDEIAIGGSGYASYREYYQTQIEVIKSYSTAKEVFDEFKISENTDYVKAKEPVKEFLKKLSVDPVRDTRLLKISFSDKSSQLAAEIVNRWALLYITKNLSYISDSENVNLLKNEYIKLQTKYSEYSKIYKEKHPKMIRLKKELEQMSQKAQSVQDENVLGDMVRVNNIKIVDPAIAPIKPDKPRKMLNLVLALVVGVFGGIGLIFFFEYMDNTIKTADDVERYVKLPVLGYVPFVISKDKDKELDASQRATIVHTEPRSTVSEAYRSIRTSLLCASSEDKPINTILVTSPSPLEGKSTTAVNLGIVLAQGPTRVLLVDADMRKPQLHNFLGIKNEIGLSNFLSQHIDIQDIIKKTEIENLSVVTCGTSPPNPAELLGSNKMKMFLAEAAKIFNRVIIDSPPMAVVTDAAILSGITDGSILVIYSNKTTRDIFPHIRHIFKSINANVLGVIVNNISIYKGGYYYQYDYYYKKE